MPDFAGMTYSYENAYLCARTKPHQEKQAILQLSNQRVESYCPFCIEIKGSKEIIKPLFRPYLFIKKPASGQWRFLLSTRGIQNIIMSAGIPAIVPYALIEELKSRENKEGFIMLDNIQEPQFKRGDRIRVTDGVFINETGIYEGQTKEEREIILLNILGRETRVHLKSSIIQKT